MQNLLQLPMYSPSHFVHNHAMADESLFHYKDVLIVLAAAGVVIPLLMRLGFSSILGFLVVGLLLGPHLLGHLVETIPALSIFSIADAGILSKPV